jgi:LysM repeat protein
MPSRYFRAVRAAHAGTALAGLLTLAGCSMFHRHPATAMASAAPVASADVAAAPSATDATQARPQTVTDELTAPADSTALDASAADSGSADTTTVVADVGPELKSTAPKSYVVRRGDTLWGIANMFLRDPWTWPEIWYVNPQIHNPHRIYPGDQLQLALGSNGRTALQLVRAQVGPRGPLLPPGTTRLRPLLRSSALDTPIEAIPYSILAAFLSHPTVLSMDQIRSAGYIVGLPQNHDIAGLGNEVFIKQISGEVGARYSVLHMDQPLIDPDNGHRVGYLAIYTGTAELTRPGRVSEAVLTDSARETLPGDVLIPEEHESIADFAPHVPDRPVSGRIMAVVDNVLVVGQNQVVAINRGSNDGLERGNVLTVDQEVEQVPDPCANIENSSTCVIHPTVTMPTDVAGNLLVFRTYPHMSYALILEDTVPIQVGARVHSP